MQTRRDQLHAYRFLTRRALAALVTGEPNAVEPPMRRLTLTTVSGVMIAVLVAAGFALFGFLKPSAGDSWKAQGTIIVERETGARYVYLDNRLDPVLNYSSGVLAVSGNGGSSQAHVTLVDRSDIADTPRGPTIGIDGIPDSLPSTGDLVTGPWTVCSQEQPGRPTELQARVTMYVGGTDVATPLESSRSVVVQDVAGQHRYLLFQGQRLLLGSSTVQTLLRIDNIPVLTVGTALLNALAPGTPLTTPTVPGLGDTGPVIDGHPTVVGELVHATDTQQDAVVLSSGVASVNPVQAALLRSVRLNGRLVPSIDTTEDKILSAASPSASATAFLRRFAGLPQSLPTVTGTPAAKGDVCVVYQGSSAAAPQFATTASKLPAFPAPTIVESATSAGGQADAVTVLPGHAALVRSRDGSPTVFAVSEPGQRYAFASAGLLTAFGYGSVAPTTLPGQVLQLIPTGPALDPAAARTPVQH